MKRHFSHVDNWSHSVDVGDDHPDFGDEKRQDEGSERLAPLREGLKKGEERNYVVPSDGLQQPGSTCAGEQSESFPG